MDGDSSDYGTDIELNEELLHLLDSIPPPPSQPPHHVVRLPNDSNGHSDAGDPGGDSSSGEVAIFYPRFRAPSETSLYYDCASTASTRPPSPAAVTTTIFTATTPPPADMEQPPGEDPTVSPQASPYDRFRARKKVLSVTDLVSNIWCEQQFEYTLLRGYRRQTPQMERGSRVHRVLEEQVHTTVPVDVTTREDRWGLKLFNMYQGLQSLRCSGLTRELPVFGYVHNIFVQGIIDEISFVTPSAREEAAEEGKKAVAEERKMKRKYMNTEDGEEEGERMTEKKDGEEDDADDLEGIGTRETFTIPPEGERIAYISDTKTRASRKLPSASQARATAIQLMLYHRLLSYLYDGTVDFGKALELFNLDGSAPFSDSFIAEIAALDQGLSLETLLEHNSLWGMWKLLHDQVHETMDGLGQEMGVSYRLQEDGSILAFKAFEHDNDQLDTHLEEVIRWWKGERGTVGVDVEEAWKCRSCEFEAECTWRLAKAAELRQTHRQNKSFLVRRSMLDI